MRCIAALLFVYALSAQTLITRSFGGSGNDAITGIAHDPSGNIYVTGTTTSFDLPLLHPSQTANPGTSLVFSTDSGVTWKSLSNPPIDDVPDTSNIPFAVDPANAAVLYVGAGAGVLKSIDGGKNFIATGSLPSPIDAIVIDPTAPQTIYAAGGGVFKSLDGGTTWNSADTGLPSNIYVYSLTMDPFHPQSLWIFTGDAGWTSPNGGQSWSQVPILIPSVADLIEGNGFVFDHATPGTVYGPSLGNVIGLQKSTDGGKTWSQLTTPPLFTGIVAADPVRAGYLYSVAPQSNLFYRSRDGGATWQSFPFPGSDAGLIASDPANPDILIAGSYRSTDDGQTWQETNASRGINSVFAPGGTGLVFGWGPVTSDVFLAKFTPDGKTVLFSTYFGGMGNDIATGMRLDTSGNVWVTGNTTSVDLPVAGTPYQKQLKGAVSAFVAKFAPDGQPIASTYLPGATASALGLDGDGNVWLTGLASSPDFPLTTGTGQGVFIAELNTSLSQLVFSTYVTDDVAGTDTPGGLSIDSNNNILVTGTTDSGTFPLAGNVIHGPAAPGSRLAYLVKYDHSGNRIFSTYLGGKSAVGSDVPYTTGVAVAAGSDDSIYLTGQTSTSDFPTTPGAYQPVFKATACPYPSAMGAWEGLRFVGNVLDYFNTETFVTKLSPDGSKLVYSTFLGGSCINEVSDIALTSSGAAIITGQTDSNDFPTFFPVAGAPQMGQYTSFVSMLDPTGASVPWSTFLAAGSSPVLSLSSPGVVSVGGAEGALAQSSIDLDGPSGSIGQLQYPLNTDDFRPAIHGLLASLNVPASTLTLDLAAVLNDFSLIPGPVARGEILRLSVPGFVPEQTVDIGLNEIKPLGTTLGGAQVLFDGQPVPLIAVRPGMIVCIAPSSFGSQTSTSIVVRSGSQVSNALTVDIGAAELGMLSADGSGHGLANARNEDGQLNSPSHPAAPDSILTLYMTGADDTLAASVAFSDISGALITLVPLKGFVPGIYAGYVRVPAGASQVSLFTNYPLDLSSPYQTLTIYVSND